MKANRKVLNAEMNLDCEREEKDHLRHGVGGLFFVGDGKKWGRDVKNMEEILRNLFLEDLDCFQ